MNLLPIAYNTYKEAIRDKILYIILMFSLVMISSSMILSLLSLGQSFRVIVDIGLGTISIFGLLITLFVGTNLINREIDKKTIYLLLTKPLRRADFILGKHLGLSLTLLVITFLMSVAFYFLVWIISQEISFVYLQAIFLNYIELVLLVAFAIFFSTLASPVMSSIYTLSIYVIGHFTKDLLDFGRMTQNESLIKVLEIIYYILPDFERLNVKNLVIYSSNGIPMDVISSGFLYGFIYTATLLLMSVLIFEFKEF